MCRRGVRPSGQVSSRRRSPRLTLQLYRQRSLRVDLPESQAPCHREPRQGALPVVRRANRRLNRRGFPRASLRADLLCDPACSPPAHLRGNPSGFRPLLRLAPLRLGLVVCRRTSLVVCPVLLHRASRRCGRLRSLPVTRLSVPLPIHQCSRAHVHRAIRRQSLRPSLRRRHQVILVLCLPLNPLLFLPVSRP